MKLVSELRWYRLKDENDRRDFLSIPWMQDADGQQYVLQFHDGLGWRCVDIEDDKE